MDNFTKMIRVFSKEIKTEKNKFFVYSTNINGQWYKIKFRRECENVPSKSGIFYITINYAHTSVQVGEEYLTRDGEVETSIPTIWVSSIVDIREETQEELVARNIKTMKEVFGE